MWTSRLPGIKAVQTLSRLNRAHPKKHDPSCWISQTTPRRLRRVPGLLPRHDPERGDRPEQAPRPEGELDGHQVYSCQQIDELVGLYLDGRGRDKLDPDSRRLCRRLRGQARRGRTSRVQGQGQGVRAHLRLPCRDPALRIAGVGEALDLPELPDPEAARAEGGRPLQGHAGSHRHG